MTKFSLFSSGAGNAGQDGSNRSGLPDSAVLAGLFIASLLGLYLLLTSTTSLIPGIWAYDAKRILQYVLLFLLFLAPTLNRRIGEEFAILVTQLPSWLRSTLIFVFVWGLVSSLINAQSLMHALNSLAEVVLLSTLLLGILVVAACRRVGGRLFDQLALGLLALTGIAVGIQELIGATAAHAAALDFNFHISLMHFSWPRFYNQVQSFMVPALVALPIVFARYRLATIVTITVLTLQWYIILMTGGRGSFVSIAAATLLGIIFFPCIRKPLLRTQLVAFLLGAMLYATILFVFEIDDSSNTAQSNLPASPNPAIAEQAMTSPPFQGESSFFEKSVGRDLTNSSGRLQLWRDAVDGIKSHPLLGIGPMGYVCTKRHAMSHPHSFPLQVAEEWGLPVAISLMGMFLFLLVQASGFVRRNGFENMNETVVAGLLITSVLAGAFHACLSGVLVMPASQVATLLVCGMLAGMFPIGQQKVQVYNPNGMILPVLLLILGMTILGGHELSTMTSRAERLQGGEFMRPRTWQNSKVCSVYNLQTEVNF